VFDAVVRNGVRRRSLWKHALSCAGAIPLSRATL